MPEYAVLLPGRPDDWEAASPRQREDVYGVHRAFMAAVRDRGHTITGGAELAHHRHSWVVRAGAEPTEGPYAESAEQLTGFYLVHTDDLDDLLEVTAMLADAEGGVEVRLCVEDPTPVDDEEAPA